MKKLLQEFKAFINKGNVMDLAVGMIIGSAFTAIVTALVQNILTPLINWIPGTGDTGALQTVLREAVTDEAGNVVTPALILDWGAVISAIITFLCTAIVLFLIVKLFNKMKEAGSLPSKRSSRAKARCCCARFWKSSKSPTAPTPNRQRKKQSASEMLALFVYIKSKLRSFSKKSKSPTVTIPSSSILALILSLTTIILRNESSILTSERFSCFNLSCVAIS